MENAQTIAEIKSSFIRNQVRALSAAILPQEGWRDYAPETEDDLSEKTVEEALQKCPRRATVIHDSNTDLRGSEFRSQTTQSCCVLDPSYPSYLTAD
jgi:hypothetical protein